MTTKFRALVGLTYPTPSSLKAVAKAGGMSKLTDEERAKVVLKSVKAGSLCDDIPESSRKWLLKSKCIEEVLPKSASQRKGAKK